MNDLILALLLFLQGLAVPGAQSGTVEGRVFNQDGTPAAHIRITAQSAAETPVAAAEAPVLSSIVQTDVAGQYRLDDVAPGRYYISAGLLQFPTYYPGVTLIDEARVVSVSGGAVLRGIDFTLSRPGRIKVSGHVKFEGGATVPQQLRVLMTGGNTFPAPNMLVPADGAFEFSDVAPGRYTIGVSPPGGSRPQQIVVGDKDVQVDIAVTPSVTLNGTMIVPADAPRPRLTLYFTSDGIATPSGIASTGTFSVALLPGDYRVVPGQLPPGFTVKSVRAGETDLLTQSLHVALGQTLPSFEVTLAISSPPPWVKVTGRIAGQMRRSSLLTEVTLTGQNASELLSATVNADGTFEFPKVIPGDYMTSYTGGALPTPPFRFTVRDSAHDLRIVIPKAVDVSGHVTADKPGPFPMLSFVVSDNDGTSRTVSAFPNANGAFTVTLPEGEHRILLNGLTGFDTKAITYGSTNLLADSMKLDAATASEEMRITVTQSGNGAWFKVSGTVSNLPGGPGSVQLTLEGVFPTTTGSIFMTAKPDGSFEFPQVLSGTYRLRAMADGPGVGMIQSVIVGQKDLTGVNIAFPDLKHVAEHIATEGPIAPAATRPYLTLGGGGRNITVYSRTEPDGSRSASLPIGEWNVTLGAVPNVLAAKSLSYGSSNLFSEPLKVTAADTQDLRLIVAPATGVSPITVRGHIVLPASRPAFIDQALGSPTTLRLSWAVIAESSLQSDLSFEFHGLLPGTYSLCCFLGSTGIVVPGKDVTDVVLHGIVGRVVREDGTPVQKLRIPLNGGVINPNGGPTNDAGEFLLLLPEGSYRLNLATNPQKLTVKSIRYGTEDLQGQSFDVVAGKEASSLVITVR